MSLPRTTIEWATHGWSPVTGCNKVSAGCRECYAETIAKRFWGDRDFTDVRFHPERLAAPLKGRKHGRRIAVNPKSDLFHEKVTNEQIAAVFGVIAACPDDTFIVLSKRPERALEWFRWLCATTKICLQHTCRHAAQRHGAPTVDDDVSCRSPWPLPNLHLGVSVENQATADERVPLLLRCRGLAAKLIISYEPAIGPLWIGSAIVLAHRGGKPDGSERDIDGVIIGGESGPGARPFDIQWARDVIRQCGAAGVPVFMKQFGARPYDLGGDHLCPDGSVPVGCYLDLRHRKGADPSEWPEDLRIRELCDR